MPFCSTTFLHLSRNLNNPSFQKLSDFLAINFSIWSFRSTKFLKNRNELSGRSNISISNLSVVLNTRYNTRHLNFLHNIKLGFTLTYNFTLSKSTLLNKRFHTLNQAFFNVYREIMKKRQIRSDPNVCFRFFFFRKKDGLDWKDFRGEYSPVVTTLGSTPVAVTAEGVSGATVSATCVCVGRGS